MSVTAKDLWRRGVDVIRVERGGEVITTAPGSSHTDRPVCGSGAS
jgi:hypothetical protein